ncbi:MAG: hypothetical protein Tp132SUR00d2C45923861_38 [Prokaryotic dsDNA virus sp.]|nr:MAG: hypothetical protein Tp132SUR00d2C45923861_38 [Prokaryotic dsDNA virus sp.]|tara:strand:+ start:38923 stop:39216 length:294 start_codon:yes stop_codon:yes gene_type:complete
MIERFATIKDFISHLKSTLKVKVLPSQKEGKKPSLIVPSEDVQVNSLNYEELAPLCPLSHSFRMLPQRPEDIAKGITAQAFIIQKDVTVDELAELIS